MDTFAKRFTQSTPARLLPAMLLSLLVALGAVVPGPAYAAPAPPPESPGCETYGCLYEHCRQHYTRDQSEPCAYGVAYERLPDGPDNRRFVRVLWPEGYDPERRQMWDDVAYCESTWRWSINNGNGYHGGVQFHPNTWALYGGHEYAAYAFQATPEQQIAIAERVAFDGFVRDDGRRVDPQGPGAWPKCGRNLTPRV